ncbi:MAG TPA: LPXTG cell wall anchor domain-containing protein [Actinomycetes bacterium]|nr:LPXTG cell wall anchor domain-containing protein [Actinomycetes bacterium]
MSTRFGAAAAAGPGAPTHRRSWPRLAGALLAAVVLLAGAAAPAAAHGARVRLKVEPTSPASPGATTRVGAVARYDDGDLAPGLTVKGVATAGGRRVAFTLRPATRPGAYAAEVRLAPGRWALLVTASGSSAGKGTGTVQVAAPTTTAAPAPAPSPSGSPQTVTATPPTGSSNASTLVLVGLALAAALAALALTLRGRRRAGP